MKAPVDWRPVIPTLFTLAAMLSGFFSILFIVQGFSSEESGRFYLWASRLIMIAMIFDGVDGNIARWIKGSTDFGAELDTYVDLIAFGIAPAILLYAVRMQTEGPLLGVLLPSAVALSGFVRLARFKVSDPLRGQGGYRGLPITVNAGWVSLFVFISQVPPSHQQSSVQFSLQSGWFATLFLVGTVVFISLQISNIRFPKPTKSAYLFAPCMALVALFVFLDKQNAVYVAIVMLVLGLAYAVTGPIFVKGVEAYRSRKGRRENEG